MTQLSEHDVAVNARLTAMKVDDWREIKGMSSAQLDEFTDLLNSTGRGYSAENPFVILRGEAVQAVKDERHARTLKVMRENQERQHKRDSVNQLEFALRTARQKLESVSEIENLDLSELFEMPPQPQPLTADDMVDIGDAELAALLQTYSGQAKSARESQAVAAEKVAAFAFAKPREARTFEKFFSEAAIAWNDCAEIAASNVQSISGELDRRKSEREAQEEAMRPKSLLERIEQLESQLAEKEGK